MGSGGTDSGDFTRVGVPVPEWAGECTIPPRILGRMAVAGGELSLRKGSGLIIPLRLFLASRYEKV